MMKCGVVVRADGGISLLIPAMKDRARPKRQVGMRTEMRTRLDYNFAAEQIVEVQEPVEVPVFEYIQTDEQWAKRCIAIMAAKNPRCRGRQVIVEDYDALPPRSQRHKWRVQNGKVVLEP